MSVLVSASGFSCYCLLRLAMDLWFCSQLKPLSMYPDCPGQQFRNLMSFARPGSTSYHPLPHPYSLNLFSVLPLLLLRKRTKIKLKWMFSTWNLGKEPKEIVCMKKVSNFAFVTSNCGRQNSEMAPKSEAPWETCPGWFFSLGVGRTCGYDGISLPWLYFIAKRSL